MSGRCRTQSRSSRPSRGSAATSDPMTESSSTVGSWGTSRPTQPWTSGFQGCRSSLSRGTAGDTGSHPLSPRVGPTVPGAALDPVCKALVSPGSTDPRRCKVARRATDRRHRSETIVLGAFRRTFQIRASTRGADRTNAQFLSPIRTSHEGGTSVRSRGAVPYEAGPLPTRSGRCRGRGRGRERPPRVRAPRRLPGTQGLALSCLAPAQGLLSMTPEQRLADAVERLERAEAAHREAAISPDRDAVASRSGRVAVGLRRCRSP
jgi:hypothetical protein